MRRKKIEGESVLDSMGDPGMIDRHNIEYVVRTHTNQVVEALAKAGIIVGETAEDTTPRRTMTPEEIEKERTQKRLTELQKKLKLKRQE